MNDEYLTRFKNELSTAEQLVDLWIMVAQIPCEYDNEMLNEEMWENVQTLVALMHPEFNLIDFLRGV